MKYQTLDVKAIVTQETLDRMAQKQATDRPITVEDAPTNAEITEGRPREGLTKWQRLRIKLKAAGGMLVKGLIAAAAVIGVIKLFNPAFVVPAMLLGAANMGMIADFACKALAAFKDGATALFTKGAALAGAR